MNAPLTHGAEASLQLRLVSSAAIARKTLTVASKRRRVLTVRERQHRAMLRFAAWIAALSLALVLREG